jgi:hypothetical protein
MGDRSTAVLRRAGQYPAAIVILVAVATVSACGGPPPRLPNTSSSAATSCAGTVLTGALPEWARAGFTPPTQPVPHVIGVNGDIVGVLFGQPLHSPPGPGRQNKILWLSRIGSGGDALRIDARLTGSDVTASRAVTGGPGPSIIDLPGAGCWSLSLSWSGHHDQVSVPYVQG